MIVTIDIAHDGEAFVATSDFPRIVCASADARQAEHFVRGACLHAIGDRSDVPSLVEFRTTWAASANVKRNAMALDSAGAGDMARRGIVSDSEVSIAGTDLEVSLEAHSYEERYVMDCIPLDIIAELMRRAGWGVTPPPLDTAAAGRGE